jgi:hypothetical protein
MFEKALPMSMVGFPLLLIPLAIYNIIVWLMPGVSLAEPLVTLPIMTSGAQWPVTPSDVLVTLGILMLLFEVIKGARPGAKFLTDHLLSLIVFGGALAEFLLWPRFANSAFFLLTLLALVDFLTGVTLRVRRGAPATVTSGRVSRRAPVTREPAPEPVDVRQEPDLHGGSWRPAEEAPKSSESFAPSSPVHPDPAHPQHPAPSEPRFDRPESSVAPPSEAPSPHDDGRTPPPSETTRH